MPKKKYQKPLHVDLPFDEALERFAQTDPAEVEEAMAEDEIGLPMRVLQDADTGARFIVHTSEDGLDHDLLFDGEQPWFTQLQLAQIYGVDVRTANHHVKRFMAAGELDDSVIRNFRITASDGKPYDVKHYGLDVAFYVGYRVNSQRGILFRRWATNMLVQIAKNGFVIEPRKLKGKPDQIAKLRKLIQDIRGDEANVYAELRSILAMCQDYNASAASNLFFASFQNRLLYAITGRTAAELLLDRADVREPNMGLQTWDGPRPLQEDALIGKNYLGQLEIEDLNRLVTMVLDFFEDQTKRGWLVLLSDADAKLGEILAVNKRKMLPDGPRATAAAGERHAKVQYRLFDKQRREERKRLALAELNEKAKKLPPKKLEKKG